MVYGLNICADTFVPSDDYTLVEVKKFLPDGKLKMIRSDKTGDYYYILEQGKQYAVATIPQYITTTSGILNGGWGKKVANELVANLKPKDSEWVMKRLLGKA